MQRLTLRPLRLTDIVYFNRWWNDPELRRLTSGSVGRVTPHDVAEFVVEMLNKSEDNHWMILVSKQTIGHISLEVRPHEVMEMRIMIGEKSFWGKGYGTRATQSVIRRAKTLHAKKIVLLVRKDNVRAIHMYQACGFLFSDRKNQGKKRAQLWMAKTLA